MVIIVKKKKKNQSQLKLFFSGIFSLEIFSFIYQQPHVSCTFRAALSFHAVYFVLR